MEGSAGTPFFSMDGESGHEAGARCICTQLRGRRCAKSSCHVPHHTSWRCKTPIVLDNTVSPIFCFSVRNRVWPGEPACSTMAPLTMLNAWRAKLPCEFLCIQLLKVVWDKMYRIEPHSVDMVTTFLGSNPLATRCQKSNMPFFLLPVWPV